MEKRRKPTALAMELCLFLQEAIGIIYLVKYAHGCVLFLLFSLYNQFLVN